MTLFNSIIGYPLGWIMWALYAVIKNYGLALFVFTLIMKIVSFPMSLKQQKSTAKTMMLQPQIAEIQRKYKDNKEKINEETMALYQKEGYSPMSGCAPSLVPMVLLFGMIDVIYNPLKHILRLPQDIIDKGVSALENVTGGASGAISVQLELIRNVKANSGAFSAMGADIVEQIRNLNFDFLWMDLTQQPSMGMFSHIFTDFNPVLLIPIFSGLSALASSLQATRNSAQQANGMMKGMMYIMPLFSTWIAFSVPAGVGLYWCFSNLLSLGQMAVMNRIYNPREIMEQAKREQEERQELERQDRIEAKKKLKEAAKEGGKKGKDISPEDEAKALTQKEINRRKLAEARKRDAEKYGEAYVEVTDEDLQ